MLMIERQLPIKKMALYGSMAVLIGFTGTYAILNELFPTDDPNLAGSSLNTQEASRASVSNQIPTKEEESKSDKDSAAPLSDNGLVIRESAVPQQQTLRTAPASPQPAPATASAPISSPSMTVAPAAPSTSGGTVAPSNPTPVITQPAPAPQPAPQPDPVVLPPIITSPLQTTVDGVNNTLDTDILP